MTNPVEPQAVVASQQPLATTACDIADKYLSQMRKQAGHLKFSEVPEEKPPRTDVIVMTQEVLDAIDEDVLRYKIGRLLIVVGTAKTQPRLQEFYRLYERKTGFTVYSRIYPGLEV
jgi:hypothetical protein